MYLIRVFSSHFTVRHLPRWFNFHKVAAQFRERNFAQTERPYQFVKGEIVCCFNMPISSGSHIFFRLQVVQNRRSRLSLLEKTQTRRLSMPSSLLPLRYTAVDLILYVALKPSLDG